MFFTLSSVHASLKKFLEEEFECTICLESCTDTLVNPECNHRFCGKCIKESLHKCNHECPTCRVPIPTYRTCRRDPQFDRILDRLVKEFIVPLEKQISSEQEEKQVVEEETNEIVGQKRRARTCAGTSSTSSASKEMIAVGGKRRSKRVKVSPAYYVPAEEESLEAWSYASSGVVIRNNALTVTAAPRPLDHSSAIDETTMNVSNEDTNIGSSRRVSAVAAATTMVHKRRKVWKTFDERFKDLKAFKAEFGHCNAPKTDSVNNKHSSLGRWCNAMRMSYKIIKVGGKPKFKLSKADMKRLEKAGFEWNLSKKVPFDERFKDLMAFKAEFDHCNVPYRKSNNNKHCSLGNWCNNIRQSYKAIKEGGMPRNKLSKANIKRLENAGFQWSSISKTCTFDKRFKDLMAFKAEFDHCNVPVTKSSKHCSLGKWCSDMRRSYKAIKEGGTPRCKLSEANIKRLEKAGFKWRRR